MATVHDKYIGSQLKLLRLSRGYSLEKLGKFFGVKHQQVQMYEKGTTRICASRMFEVSKLFNVKTDYFRPPELGGVEIKPLEADIKLKRKMKQINKLSRDYDDPANNRSDK